MDSLLAYEWPGNIRELRNVVERTVIICPADVITPGYLPADVSGAKPRGNVITIAVGTSLEDAEKDIIIRTLSSVENNKSKAAVMLGLSRKALYNKLKRFGEM